MANITVKHLIDQVAELLQDEGFVDWEETKLVEWYNISARQVVVAAPAANIVIEPVKLASGVKQSLPSTSLELVRVVRNMGTDGETPGGAVTGTTIDMIQRYNRNWNTETATTAIKHAMREQAGFWYCYPPSDGTGYVEIESSKVPTLISWDENGAWESALVGIDDKYLIPLMHLIMFYAYSKDTDFPGSEDRATKHFGLFTAGVGGQSK